jgi:ubiquinone/menaquinone biosynthesis C-methylase UbiE
MTCVGTNNQSTREDWLAKTLAAVPAGMRILDAGAGELAYKHLCSHLDYVSQDFAAYDGRGDDRGLQMGEWDYSGVDIISDITAIPEPSHSFDVVMCIEVFEHLAEPLKALDEFSRLLRPNGKLIITAPFCSLTHFAPYHFYTGFNRYFYEQELPRRGFEIKDLSENGNYFEFVAQEVRRIPSVENTYTETPGASFCRRVARRIKGRREARGMRVVLGMLERCSRDDKGSQEILHFGYHVLAVKKDG